MRAQSNELLTLAKELREHVYNLNLPMDVNDEGNLVGVNIKVSDNVRMHYNSNYEYSSIEFNLWPNTVTATLFKNGEFNNNTIAINVEKVSDADLDAIILQVKEDIAIFKGLKLIKKDAIYTSSSSI